jgi:hypothetical protein
MITRLTAEITPINCATLKSVVFPIQIPKNTEPSHKVEIILLKSKDKENLYNSVQIDVNGCKLSIENNCTIQSPDNNFNIMARTNLEVFLTILGFCLRDAISTKSINVTTLPMRFEYLSETAEEKRKIEEFSKEVIVSSLGGASIISSNSTTNDDIFNYYNLIDPISFFMNAEKAESPIFKIREYRRIFDYFDKRFKDKPRFSKFKDKALTHEIIKEYAGLNISKKTIRSWWTTDNKCSHGGTDYVTPLNSEGLKEVTKANKEIRPIARLLIEKIALNETRT